MTLFVAEAARQTPVHAEVDVLVVGGGPAGVDAAVSAARGGARTRLVRGVAENCWRASKPWVD